MSSAVAMRCIYCNVSANLAISFSRRPASRQNGALKRMQIRHQLVHLLLAELVLECRHLRPAEQDDVQHAIVIRGHSVVHELPLEQPMQARAAKITAALGEE